ncbi:glycogen synthase [bacterium]|nr:glycogen synthase [bacterium]
MNILFAGVECFPFIKIGGLGDVLGSLPKELNSLGADTRVIMPKYSVIKEELLKDIEFVDEFYVFVANKANTVKLWKLKHDGVVTYFIENEKYFNRDRVYDFPDEMERWALFQIAVVESLKYMDDFKVDILNCHDWHTGMIPELIKVKYFKEYGSIKTVFTIHNIMFQGECDRQTAKLFNIPFSNVMEQSGKMNFMKSAIVASDYVNTVSETYSKELLSSEYFSMGLGSILNQKAKAKAFGGILNGLDYSLWNPKTDKTIPFNYSFENYKIGKEKAKRMLYDKLERTDFYTDVPMMAIVSRLTRQKGLDLITEVINNLLNDYTFKFIVIGTGEKWFEDFFLDLEKQHPYKVKCYIGYSDELAHLAYAASDIFLMPSAFEPCGLGQMIALRYGSLPLVRETGGLKDSVMPFNEYTMEGNGFSFTNYNAYDMDYVIRYAFRTYKDKYKWDCLVKNAMESDYSFYSSAIKYFKLYKRLLEN